jgi:hypothetical protein
MARIEMLGSALDMSMGQRKSQKANYVHASRGSVSFPRAYPGLLNLKVDLVHLLFVAFDPKP